MAVAALLVVSTGCGSDGADEGASFDEAFKSGATCAELFEIRNEWDPKSPLVEPANEALRSIGCYTAGSERTE